MTKNCYVRCTDKVKVTNDPEASRNPINEPSGPVANDSLAAESATHGGAFSQNRGAEPLGVSGSNLNNTDTSGATKLPPASVGTQREDINRKERYPEALGGQGDFPGPHANHSSYVGGSTAMKEEFSAGHGGSGQSQYNGGAAPSYVADLKGDIGGQGGHGKPKGKNLHEGGFDSDPKYNASFNSEIGSRNDPGRVGENDMQRRVADSGPDAGGGPRQKGIDGKHLFQNLAEQSA